MYINPVSLTMPRKDTSMGHGQTSTVLLQYHTKPNGNMQSRIRLNCASPRAAHTHCRLFMRVHRCMRRDMRMVYHDWASAEVWLSARVLSLYIEPEVNC